MYKIVEIYELLEIGEATEVIENERAFRSCP